MKVLFHPLADRDLQNIYQFIAMDSLDRAIAFVRRLRAFCFGLAEFSMHGRSREDLGSGVRTFVFEKRVLVAYRVGQHDVTVLRLMYAGQDISQIAWPET